MTFKYTKADKLEAIKAYEGKKSKFSDKEALRIIEALADKKNKNDLFAIGYCYDNGIGTRKSYKKAFSWFLKAAKIGDAESQYNVSVMLRKGEGTEKNHAKSLKWLKKSSDSGFPEAMCDLGVVYFQGKRIKQNKKKAVELYKKSAKKNHPIANYNLGLSYIEGEGVKFDLKKGLQHLKIAADLGHSKAPELLSRIYSDKEWAEWIKPSKKLSKKYAIMAKNNR